MPGQKRIAVIGAGPSGLVSIKACKEEGLLPVCFERNNDPGGLWRYHDEDIEGVASVMRTTIINTSKEYGAFSDFPPPASFPNYMHNSKMFEYFMQYAKHFDLLRHIRYNLEVVKVEATPDFEKTGQWIVSVKSAETQAITKETFDGVMICIGHHVYPHIPTFPNQAKFKGSITHTHSLKSCDRYAGQRVVVVGIGNSAVDAAIDSTFVAKQVYLSTRRGSWILSRVGPKGVPFDLTYNTRFNNFLMSILPYDLICDISEKIVNAKFDHEAYNLKPKHRFFAAHPTMNDNIPNAILSGKVVVKGDILKFEENGILFSGDNEVTEVDAVILATGYQIKFPFLDDKIISAEKNKTHLYKFAIPPQLKHHTLAFIGLCQPVGSLFPISEVQSRWFALIQTGKVELPSVKEMEKDIEKRREENAKRYVGTERHTVQCDMIPYMDEMAALIGAKPNFVKMAITDPKLFWACLTGPSVPYQFRLVGPHSWSGARDAILNLEKRVFTPLNKDAKKPVDGGKSWKAKSILYAGALAAIGAAACNYDKIAAQYL